MPTCGTSTVTSGSTCWNSTRSTAYPDDTWTIMPWAYTIVEEVEEITEEIILRVKQVFPKFIKLLLPNHQYTVLPEIKRRIMFSLSGWLLKVGHLKRKGN